MPDAFCNWKTVFLFLGFVGIMMTILMMVGNLFSDESTGFMKETVNAFTIVGIVGMGVSVPSLVTVGVISWKSGYRGWWLFGIGFALLLVIAMGCLSFLVFGAGFDGDVVEIMFDPEVPLTEDSVYFKNIMSVDDFLLSHNRTAEDIHCREELNNIILSMGEIGNMDEGQSFSYVYSTIPGLEDFYWDELTTDPDNLHSSAKWLATKEELLQLYPDGTNPDGSNVLHRGNPIINSDVHAPTKSEATRRRLRETRSSNTLLQKETNIDSFLGGITGILLCACMLYILKRLRKPPRKPLLPVP